MTLCKSFPNFCAAEQHITDLCNITMESYYRVTLYRKKFYVCSNCEVVQDLKFNDFIKKHNHIGIFRRNKRGVLSGNILFYLYLLNFL